MDDIGLIYRFAKLSIGGIAALALGFFLVITGEPQSILAGLGAILAGTFVLGLIGWILYRYKNAVPDQTGNGEPAEEETTPQVLWLGVALLMAPAFVYLYLRYAMDRFDGGAVVFLSVPFLISGLGCIGVSLWQSANAADQAKEAAAEGDKETS